jgi:hypothetical protein
VQGSANSTVQVILGKAPTRLNTCQVLRRVGAFLYHNPSAIPPAWPAFSGWGSLARSEVLLLTEQLISRSLAKLRPHQPATMATDLAFLDQLTDFLITGDTILTSTTPESFQEDFCSLLAAEDTFTAAPEALCGSSFSECLSDDFNSKLSDYSGSGVQDSVLGKRKSRREKEALRKQRYHRRLKEERKALRQMESELSVRLLQLQEAAEKKKQGTVARLARATSVWKDRVARERELRAQAEADQKRLVVAVSMQASYVAKLRELLPCQPDGLKVTAPERAASTPSGGQESLSPTLVLSSVQLSTHCAAFCRKIN